MPIPLAIVGCGGMGHRHLRGLIELHRAGWDEFTVVAACDPVTENAESLAGEVAAYFGAQPHVVATLDDLAPLGVAAVDITTTPRSHHTIAAEALARGWHVLLEKPMGLTVRACNIIRRAAAQSGQVLSVAENYRRDPVNRLAKALIAAGAIGAPRLLVHHSLGGADQMLISVWRHQKDQSGILLDVGVHYTDMMEFLLGPIESLFAHTRLHEPVRHNPAATGDPAAAGNNPAGVYGRWQKQMPASFAATAEDAVYATVQFANGAIGQYIEDHAAHGESIWVRQIHGATGSLSMPNDRSGIALRLHRRGELRDEELLALVPDFRLDPVTAALFGGERIAAYAFEFAETDRKLLAVEYADFAQAIRGEHPPEVDADQGARAVAGIYAMFESSLLGRPVSVAETLNEQVGAYQQSIDAGMGLA
jgi:predicted dehydrogenase